MFSSVVYQSPYMDIFRVNINFGGSNVNDQTINKSTYLGLMHHINNVASETSGTYTTFYYTRAKQEDNIQILIEYPNINIINVTISNIYIIVLKHNSLLQKNTKKSLTLTKCDTKSCF